jgi:hypothetical protein
MDEGTPPPNNSLVLLVPDLVSTVQNSNILDYVPDPSCRALVLDRQWTLSGHVTRFQPWNLGTWAFVIASPTKRSVLRLAIL